MGATPDDVTITVEDKPSAFESLIGDILSTVLVANRVASFTATDAEISGNNITINASSATQTRWDDVGEYVDSIGDQLLGTLSEISDIVISLISPISGQVKIQKATGEIKLTNTTVAAGGEVDASFTTVGINGAVANVPFIVNIGYGETLAKANVDLAGTTTITADGDVVVTSTVASENEVSSRAAANTRLSNSDSIDVGVSLGIALANQESTVTLGQNARIETTSGSVDVGASSEGETSAEGEAIIVRDGVAGLTVGVAVEKATIISDVLGTIIAANPQGAAVHEFDAAALVSLVDDTITLQNIDPDKEIQRGQELNYRANGNAPIGGLLDGTSYFVADVENVPPGLFTGTKRIRLRSKQRERFRSSPPTNPRSSPMPAGSRSP